MSHDQNPDPPTPDPYEQPWRSCGGFDDRYRNCKTLDVGSKKIVDTFAEHWRKRERGHQVEMVMFKG